MTQRAPKDRLSNGVEMPRLPNVQRATKLLGVPPPKSVRNDFSSALVFQIAYDEDLGNQRAEVMKSRGLAACSDPVAALVRTLKSLWLWAAMLQLLISTCSVKATDSAFEAVAAFPFKTVYRRNRKPSLSRDICFKSLRLGNRFVLRFPSAHKSVNDF